MRKTLILASVSLGMVAVATAATAPARGHQSTDLPAKVSHAGNINDIAPSSAPAKVAEHRDTHEYDFEYVEIGTSRYDYQHNGSMGKMIAVSSDGVIHATYMGGTDTATNRRVLAACVDADMNLIGVPTNVMSTRTGYTTCATTSEDPANGQPANSTVAAQHTGTASWFGIDFAGCTMAFNNVQHTGADQLWPHVALDYNDKVFMVSGDASTGAMEDAVWFDSSADGITWDDGEYLMLTDNSNTLAHNTCAAKNGPGAAVMFMIDSPCDEAILDNAPQWHHDILYYEANDAVNDLHSVIENSDPINITNYMCPESTAPFAFGAFAYADIDGIYDLQDTPQLHIAFPTPMVFADSFNLHEWGNDTLFFSDTIQIDYWGAIWHYNAATESWSLIAGMMTPDGEDAGEAPDPGVFRIARDRVQLAVDEDTGYLYAIWNQYSDDDRRGPWTDDKLMPNGEIYAACSNDNGETWGDPVNLTNTQTPDCDGEDNPCASETFATLAEHVTDGYLHIQFMNDLHAGSFIRSDDANDGSMETVNSVYYMRVPVEDVPPADGPRPGHVGIYPYKRQYGFYSNDSTYAASNVRIFNESDETVFLSDITVYHDMLDDLQLGANGDFTVEIDIRQNMLDPEVGYFMHDELNWDNVEGWDGTIAPWSAITVRLQVRPVNEPMTPLREHAFKFTMQSMSGAVTERIHRFAYLVPDGEDPLVAEIDINDLDAYTATPVYEFTEDVNEPGALVPSFELAQNYPNPFNPTTEISFKLEQRGETSLRVYNIMGELVSTLVAGQMPAGQHSVSFDGNGLASGVYFYTLESRGFSQTRKMLLAK